MAAELPRPAALAVQHFLGRPRSCAASTIYKSAQRALCLRNGNHGDNLVQVVVVVAGTIPTLTLQKIKMEVI